MDLKLPILAEINFHLSVTEEAISEEDFQTARYEIEKAEISLSELRKKYPEMNVSEKGLLNAMVQPLKARYNTAMDKIPNRSNISQGKKEANEDTEADESVVSNP